MRQNWLPGNKFTLLENGEAFYPRVYEVIARARREVMLETFILRDDKVGRALQSALMAAARRGVQVDVTVDGWGSADLPDAFIAALTDAGVRMHVFEPAPKWIRRLSYFRRMHRKLIVVDGERAFVGGINFSADHLADFGPEAKQDYAVEAKGPIVGEIHRFMRAALAGSAPGWHWFRRRAAVTAASVLSAAGRAHALFAWRDNHRHRSDIERQYRLAIRLATRSVVIANAYFFPGYAFLRELRKAAARGVKVSLILQGNPDIPIVQTAAAMLYDHLLGGGVRIYEYCDRPLHGKVALVDDTWATVGSSNLDPLSLALNMEANVIIHDREFNSVLNESLQRLMNYSCKRIEAADLNDSKLRRKLRSFFLFHLLRRYPAWAGRLPAHVPRIAQVQPASDDATVPTTNKTALP